MRLRNGGGVAGEGSRRALVAAGARGDGEVRWCEWGTAAVGLGRRGGCEAMAGQRGTVTVEGDDGARRFGQQVGSRSGRSGWVALVAHNDGPPNYRLHRTRRNIGSRFIQCGCAAPVNLAFGCL